MRKLQDMTAKETADALGTTDGNVGIILHRAIKVMRAYLQAPPDTDTGLRVRPKLRHPLTLIG